MAQEGKTKKRKRDADGIVAARGEDYLESLLTEAFKGKGFHKISELLQEGEVEPLQKYSKPLFNQLDKTLRRELDRNEFANVSLLLKCIQLFLKSDLQEGASLFVEQGLIEKMISWFERTRAFVILSDMKDNKYLRSLLEEIFDSALAICKCSNEGKKQLVNLFLPELGELVTEANIGCALRQEALRTLNSILDSVSREERKKFPLSEEMCLLMKDLAGMILEVGDYELQAALSEALCRLTIKKWRRDLVHQWFEDNNLAEAFKEIKDGEFDTDCRKFLNRLNENLGNGRRVYSLPCISAFADMNELKKPSGEKLEEFWIDFNAGSQSVTFYVDGSKDALWDSVRLSKEAVSSYSLKESDGEKIVKIYMKIPPTLGKMEATKIKIFFNARFEILSVLKKVLGEEKLVTDVAEEESGQAGKQASHSEGGIPESTNSQGRKDPSNSKSMDFLSDSLASQHIQQLTGTAPKLVNPGVTMITWSQQTDVEDTNQGSAKKSKTPSPRMKTQPSEKPLEEQPMEVSTSKNDVTQEKRNRRTSLAKQRTEGRKDICDFESSDSASRDMVAEAKRKVLSPEAVSQNQRVYKTRNKNEDSNSVERRLFNYRKHLFSESNNENTSTDQSDKSWILDSQKPALPKFHDYTRKRPRVRSKLRVLPMSPASSGSDDQTKKQGASRRRYQKEMLRKNTSSSEGDDLPTVDLAGEVLSEELEGGPLPLNASAKGESGDEEAMQKPDDVSGKLSQEGSFQWNDSGGRSSVEALLSPTVNNILSCTVTKKPRSASGETSHFSSDTKARNHVDSLEKKGELQTDQAMDDSVDDVVSSKLLHEDISDSEVVAAFESFTSQLKKLFWTRYKKMEISAHNALEASEKNLFTLLKQIHECRLSKLEAFQKIVVEKLASLEKETQILVAMEKDAMDFWTTQLQKLNSFSEQQKQRIQSVDSTLGENAKSFADNIQNTSYDYPMQKEVENDVFIVLSD